MARKRSIDTDGLYFDSELIKALGRDGVLVYARLWGLSEDWGGIKINAQDLSYRMGALHFTEKECADVMQKLIHLKKMIPYEVEGKTYYWIKNLMKHNPLNNPAMPTLPLPPWVKCEPHSWPSGKKYAKFQILAELVPNGDDPVKPDDPIEGDEVKPPPVESTLSPTREWFADFNAKLKAKGYIKRDLLLTHPRKRIIETRFNEKRTLADLKTCTDNFLKDDFKDRAKYFDVQYCLGVVRGIDQFDKWFNYKPDGPEKTAIHLEQAQNILAHAQTHDAMLEVFTRLVPEDREEFQTWIKTQDDGLRAVYQSAIKIWKKKKEGK